jgi:hypothetical protein
VAFLVGQRVVCVDDHPDDFGREIFVKKGGVYTVIKCFDWHGIPGVLIAEHDPGEAAGWLARRFRPIVERKTDISIFTAMLKPQRVNA